MAFCSVVAMKDGWICTFIEQLLIQVTFESKSPLMCSLQKAVFSFTRWVACGGLLSWSPRHEIDCCQTGRCELNHGEIRSLGRSRPLSSPWSDLLPPLCRRGWERNDASHKFAGECLGLLGGGPPEGNWCNNYCTDSHGQCNVEYCFCEPVQLSR